MTNIDKMVDRFLMWKLPKRFSPDHGISFKPSGHYDYDKPGWWPVGTNLLNADQAREMIEYILDYAPAFDGKSVKHELNRECVGEAESGSITPTCSCGWIGRTAYVYNDYCYTNVKEQEYDHLRKAQNAGYQTKGE